MLWRGRRRDRWDFHGPGTEVHRVGHESSVLCLKHSNNRQSHLLLLLIIVLVLFIDLIIEGSALDGLFTIGEKNHSDELRGINHAVHVRKNRLEVGGFAVSQVFEILQRVACDQFRPFRGPNLQWNFAAGVQLVAKGPNADAVSVVKLSMHTRRQEILQHVSRALGTAVHG